MPTICIVGSNRGISLKLVRHFSNRGDTVYALCQKTSAELNKLKNVVVLGQSQNILSYSMSSLTKYELADVLFVIMSQVVLCKLENKTLKEANNAQK